MEIKNAIIESASITIADKGLLDCWLNLDYGGVFQGFGGYALYLPKSFKHHSIDSPAGHHIFRILQCAGVEDWSNLKGKPLRVGIKDGLIRGICHIIKDDWYYPSVDFGTK